MKKKILAVAGLALVLGLYSFKAEQKWGQYTNENGDQVFVLDPGETMTVDGVDYTNNDPIIQEKWVLCPGSGVACTGEIKTPGPGGVTISYNDSKDTGSKNIVWVKD